MAIVTAQPNRSTPTPDTRPPTPTPRPPTEAEIEALDAVKLYHDFGNEALRDGYLTWEECFDITATGLYAYSLRSHLSTNIRSGFIETWDSLGGAYLAGNTDPDDPCMLFIRPLPEISRNLH